MYVNKDPFREPLTSPNKYQHINPGQKVPKKPEPLTINDLFPQLDRLSIGWSPVLDQLRQATLSKPSYPPYDLISVGDDQNILDVAVAGFTKSEISVTVQDSVLVIKGEKNTERAGEVIHKGIAARDFELRLAMAEYWEVIRASMDNGLLTVLFSKNLPEEKKPKVIDIK
jgi:molecular chaperone IbpA